MITGKAFAQSWPIHGTFTISRGSKTRADVIVVELSCGNTSGYGECVPYARYQETVESVLQEINQVLPAIQQGTITHENLYEHLGAGAARNALDCAFWDLQSQLTGTPAWQLAELKSTHPLSTAYTLSLDTPEQMFIAAQTASKYPLLKLKLAGDGDLERVSAVRKGAPSARIIVDANEGWNVEIYQQLVPEFIKLGVEMIEQPFPAKKDDVLASLERPITVCADESCHDSTTLHRLIGKYDMVNIKLDKTGGLSEALKVLQKAKSHHFKIMVGCMVGTSLSMLPAFVVAQNADIVDLDGPLLLAKDRENGIRYEQSLMHTTGQLWGGL